MEAISWLRPLWSCEQCCSKDDGATCQVLAQRSTPGQAWCIQSQPAGKLLCAEGSGEQTRDTRQVQVERVRHDSDSKPGWEKTAHDLAKQRDALRGSEIRLN
jgi:hypothetical protein